MQSNMQGVVTVAGLSLCLAVTAAGQVLHNPKCDDAGGPTICVRFDNLLGPPEEGFDFSFDFSDPDKPSVDFILGDDGAGTTYQWRVWSVDSGNPGAIGDITGLSKRTIGDALQALAECCWITLNYGRKGNRTWYRITLSESWCHAVALNKVSLGVEKQHPGKRVTTGVETLTEI